MPKSSEIEGLEPITDNKLREALRYRAGLPETTATDAYVMLKAEQRLRQLTGNTVLICPERDARCPHGPDCPYAIDRYSCDILSSRAALSARPRP